MKACVKAGMRRQYESLCESRYEKTSESPHEKRQTRSLRTCRKRPQRQKKLAEAVKQSGKEMVKGTAFL